MSYEPLNLKKIKKLIEECARDYEVFGDARIESTFIDIRDHIKSVILGLLEEIKKIKKSLNESIKQAEKEDVSHAKHDFWFALDIVEQIEGKIKKWFPDIVEIRKEVEE